MNSTSTRRFRHRLVLLSLAAVACPALAEPTTRVIAGDGRSAMDCVHLQSVAGSDSTTSGGGRVLANRCTDEVEAGWCYVDGDCRTETGSSWTIQPGRSWPVNADREIRWAACHGRDTMSFEKGSHGTRYICKAPAGQAASGAAAPGSAGTSGSSAETDTSTQPTQTNDTGNTIHFADGSAEIDAAAAKTLDRIYAQREEKMKLAQVDAVGYAGQGEVAGKGPEHHVELARKRARNVLDYLERRGVDPGVMTTETHVEAGSGAGRVEIQVGPPQGW